MERLRVLSYNIHKGFSSPWSRFVLDRIKESIRTTDADIVLLQEVMGEYEGYDRSQFEFLADSVWTHFAYGKNAVYSEGHHGNATLSKFPILAWDNFDISTNRLERRGFLHAELQVPNHAETLHVICVHLGLLEGDRMTQLETIVTRIREEVPPRAPLILGGDFNDWRQQANRILSRDLSLAEAFWSRRGSHARTFPAWLPMLSLDRIYFRGLECATSEVFDGKLWRDLSDHTPILAEFAWK